MKWKIEPFDPATVTLEQLAAAKKAHDLGRWLGAVVGVAAALIVYFIWMRLDWNQKWVEYAALPAIVLAGVSAYRAVYEIVIRVRV